MYPQAVAGSTGDREGDPDRALSARAGQACLQAVKRGLERFKCIQQRTHRKPLIKVNDGSDLGS